MIKNNRRERFLNSKQLSLGQLISKLENLISEKNKDYTKVRVVFDFEHFYPTKFDSWRGSYDELALNFVNFSSDKPTLSVIEFLNMCKDVIRKVFTGYKGGEYMMDETTPIWVANYGNSGNTALIDILDNDHEIVLITCWMKF